MCLRNSLVAGSVLQVVLRAGDGHKAFEDVLVQDAFGILGGLVGHEAVDEGEGGLRHLDPAEWEVGEVWVLLDRLGEAIFSEFSEHVKVVVSRGRIWLAVVQLVRWLVTGSALLAWCSHIRCRIET